MEYVRKEHLARSTNLRLLLLILSVMVVDFGQLCNIDSGTICNIVSLFLNGPKNMDVLKIHSRLVQCVWDYGSTT